MKEKLREAIETGIRDQHGESHINSDEVTESWDQIVISWSLK